MIEVKPYQDRDQAGNNMDQDIIFHVYGFDR